MLRGFELLITISSRAMRTQKQTPETRAVLKLLAGAVMISFSGVWVKISHVPAQTSAFYRVFFGGLVLLALASMRGEMKRRPARNLWVGLLCGLLFALDLVLFHKSVNYVGPGLGTILPNFQVFILTLLGIFIYKEKISPAGLLSMPVAIAGLFMIVGVDWGALGGNYRLGILCGLGAACCYASFLLTLRKLQSDQVGISTFYVLTAVSLTSAGFIALEILRSGAGFRIPDQQTFWALLALGVLSQAVGWIIIATSLPFVRPSLSGFILLLQPALSFIWDVVFFHRPTSRLNWLGVLVALAAIYVGATSKNSGRGKHPSSR